MAESFPVTLFAIFIQAPQTQQQNQPTAPKITHCVGKLMWPWTATHLATMK